MQITAVALIAAAISGLLMAVLFTQSKWIERSLFPYTVILQTTPIVAIAPPKLSGSKIIPLLL
ncbi:MULTISPECIES: hypothetical protein [unclassified Nostoc]|uniref:hypothetical protein n=1 Tax=unclassified Nostoc TaxID=2593658 RepID=UPI002AD58E94|nr:hypothetical protein [Nostoc sp. DedQUE03]MDZ7977388.1 hypothetical protein [Nostoc sp. DedQUE03]MDZ8045958.1 hypothetical protein [Nostoc sp. DedQUE02]